MGWGAKSSKKFIFIYYDYISSYIRKPFLMYDFAPDPIWIWNFLIYEENFIFFFISVWCVGDGF